MHTATTPEPTPPTTPEQDTAQDRPDKRSRSAEARLAAAEQRRRDIDKKIEAIRAERDRIALKRLGALTKGEHNRDTRRKILAGSWVIARMQQDEEFRAMLMAGLDGFLTRADDREVWGLPPRAGAGQQTAGETPEAGDGLGGSGSGADLEAQQ